MTASALRRELGRWDLTAIGVNQVIGGAVFAQPSLYAASVGAWSPWMVAIAGVASMLIALSFAEVSSRFDATGGPYLCTRAAFGRFAAFEVGWMLWFTRAASWAAVINALAAALGFYAPALTSGWPRATLITTIIVAITAINVRGIRQSSLVLNILTIGKLLPLAMFIIVGLAAVDPSRLALGDAPPLPQLSATGLLLIFAFGGYEVIPVPAGEAKDPRRAVPFALTATIAIVTVVMTLAQVVALGTLPGLASSTTPLADAAAMFMGASGAAMLTIGAVFSMTGNNMGQALSGSRNMFALAEQGDLPGVFGRVHPTFRTPVVAIVVTSTVSLVLALSGHYAQLALASAISRLIVYVATCASTLRLRSPRFAGTVSPPTFVVPFGPVIPAAAIVVALTILAGARANQLVAGAIALAVGAILYAIAVRRGRFQLT
ncbi:MAG TPA: APC family permease [Vicinamibacterales bacterium]|nr:APC family permease [Vicinamibacterales bacterium]